MGYAKNVMKAFISIEVIGNVLKQRIAMNLFLEIVLNAFLDIIIINKKMNAYQKLAIGYFVSKL